MLESYRDKPDKSDSYTLIKAITQTGDIQDDAKRVAEMTFFMNAGHDTTANALGLTIYLIAKHPHAKLGTGKPYEGIDNLRPESKETVATFMSWQPPSK